MPERQREMEEKIDGGGGGGGGGGVVVVAGGGGGGIDQKGWFSSSSNYPSYWWWGAASSVQMIVGIASYRRGCKDSSFMPFQAFSVASLFVGSGTTAVAALLSASGIHKVQDLKDLGANMRTGLGVPSRKTK